MYDIDFSENNVRVPVVNCVLTNDSIQYLSITENSGKVGEYKFKEITDAEAKLYANDSLIGSFKYVSNKKWSLNYQPIAGVKYKLMVNIADSVTLWATTTMPARNLLSVIRKSDQFPSKNFIQYSGYHPYWICIISSFELIFPDSKPSGNDYVLFEIGTNHPLADKLSQRGNMASVVPSATTPKYNYYIRIKSDSLIGMNHPVEFKLQANYGNSTYISFITASEEYDKYMRTSFQKVILRRDIDDPITLFDENIVYSNINNGIGIFAAYNELLVRYNDNIPTP